MIYQEVRLGRPIKTDGLEYNLLSVWLVIKKNDCQLGKHHVQTM